ncbi:C2H2-type zinc finger protein [Turicibacter sanguinis]|uniref:C2H2-type zinc finger protein n=1 Tax=Turicibacter sanguinis TaxID=154288 RepID=UPI0018986D01|nr:C2H2-type zinc finger protein [Turicibacter sanguinis]
MKKWETPEVQGLNISLTRYEMDQYGSGGGDGGGTSPGNLNFKCPDCNYCFQSPKSLADHRGTHPNNPLGGACKGIEDALDTGAELCHLS